ncbi:MAG TPA: HEAT repeat domain-containing protein [Ignavibacteriaceae bacterium]|nr:HEAT repeat domain-containing protein [Ignavibacteriaceae bacterium]
MESRLKNTFYEAVVLITVFILLSGSVLNAQNDNPVKVKEVALKNLLVGIQSENEGLQRSSIFLAGKYKLTPAIDVLSEQLAEVENVNTRILIALSLYQIGSVEILPAIKKSAANDDDLKVRKICTEIYNAFVQNNYSASLK